MELKESKKAVRESISSARAAGKTIGFVPTMGALHDGHKSLIAASAADCGCTVVSIFVNPTQFGPGEDFERYPRGLERDLRAAEDAGADLIFAPSAEEIYPPGFATFVEVGELGEVLCGASRPGHFRGAATVVAKLLNIVRPDVLYLGRKDAQQAIILTRMILDLDFDIDVRVLPTVREPDGLAMSSRNRYLSASQRTSASLLSAALFSAGELFESEEREVRQLVAAACSVLGREKKLVVEYFEARDAASLVEVSRVERKTLLVLAARIGETRLIDNVLLDPETGTFEK
ncbi:MAG: pantoate--beta-alanine ligase [Candidatus Coatesbacteria bacterium]|nr:pantoate--beta-alanine ligase [Candidatus Coatesbacteria bacterium]